MFDRKTFKYVAAEYALRESEGKTPVVHVHLVTGETLLVKTVISYGPDPQWLLLHSDDDRSEYVLWEHISRVTISLAESGRRPPGFTVEDQSERASDPS
jgi:hypothetical protein